MLALYNTTRFFPGPQSRETVNVSHQNFYRQMKNYQGTLLFGTRRSRRVVGKGRRKILSRLHTG